MSKWSSTSLSVPVPAADRALSPSRTGVVAGPVLNIDELDDDAKEQLGIELYRIFSRSYGDLDRETVCGEIIFKPGGRLALYHDRYGMLAGFATAAISLIEVAGRRRAILDGGAYFLPGTRGGSIAAKFILMRGVQFKLRNPGMSLSYVCEALNAASYRRIARTMPRYWPCPDQPTPPEYAELLRAVLDERGFECRPENPFVVRYCDPASHRNLANLQRSPTLESDRHVQFYIAANPNYADGDILCSIVPIDFMDIGRVLFADIKNTIRRIFS